MKCSVIGAGSWGTAVARHLGTLGNDVVVWSRGDVVASGINTEHRNPRYLSDVVLPDSISATTSLASCLKGADAAVLVTPSVGLRDTARMLNPLVSSDLPVIVLSKGIEQDTGKLMAEVVLDEIGNRDRIACLSGPNLAAEIAHDKPTATVIAAYDGEVGKLFQGLFHSSLFRTYLSDDVIGVETCGAAKNIVAIACGIAHGLEVGDNAAATIMTRGLAEMSRLVVSMGGNPLTCMGLAGMGDLIATCTSPRSRNFSFGESFSHGETIEQYRERTHMVVEGYYACSSFRRLAHEQGVEVPITDVLYSLLYEGADVLEAVRILEEREPKVELYGIHSQSDAPTTSS